MDNDISRSPCGEIGNLRRNSAESFEIRSKTRGALCALNERRRFFTLSTIAFFDAFSIAPPFALRLDQRRFAERNYVPVHSWLSGTGRIGMRSGNFLATYSVKRFANRFLHIPTRLDWKSTKFRRKFPLNFRMESVGKEMVGIRRNRQESTKNASDPTQLLTDPAIGMLDPGRVCVCVD